MRQLMCGVAAAAALVAVVASTAGALTQSAVYDNIPSPQPGNLPSEAFAAQSASEFGGAVALAGIARTDPTITVLMSSWGCQSGHWYSGDCSTAPGATFSEPVTLNLYRLNANGTVGALIATSTQAFNIPYRPSADSVNCTGSNAGKWYDGSSNTCFNGYATPISFTLTGVTLPDALIVSVAYDTSHYGSSPYGESTACYASAGGCGYDSLNVATTAPPSVGSDPRPDDAYLSSSWTGAYCDNGASGSGTFRLDAGCWTAYQPAIEINATASTAQCKSGGWQQFNNPAFKNQGDCVSYVSAHGKSGANG